ncbi:MAG: 4-hydroxythreonine-4-phosphate dehydrogenase PdxA [Lysobacterales bacterium]
MNPIAITVGDPAGIGPELCVKLAAGAQAGNAPGLVFVGSEQVLEATARGLGQSWEGSAYVAGSDHSVQVMDVPPANEVVAGRLDPGNALSVVKTLELALDGCVGGEFSAMVTCPVHKGVINDAGIAFTGHTEFLAHRCQTERVVMMLAADRLRVALATTHLPLSEVSASINAELLIETLTIIDSELRQRFGIEQPAIAVCGLNPHAGEGGHLGHEEVTVIEPTLAALRERGLRLTGPLPADTLFTPRVLDEHDAVLAMYHDQGLPVLKYVGFGGAINVTLGLPVIRTSVDHGTALDIAGRGIADDGSLRAALSMAQTMAGYRP